MKDLPEIERILNNAVVYGQDLGSPYELLSKLLVSPLITPIVILYIIPYITPFKEFRL